MGYRLSRRGRQLSLTSSPSGCVSELCYWEQRGAASLDAAWAVRGGVKSRVCELSACMSVLPE